MHISSVLTNNHHGKVLWLRCLLIFLMFCAEIQFCSCSPDEEFILVADYSASTIYKVDLHNGTVLDSVSTPSPNGVLYDHTTDTVLFASTNKYVNRVHFNGSGETTIYDTGEDGTFPDRIAMDFPTGSLYYTANTLSISNGSKSFIGKVSPNGTHQVIVQNLSSPRDIVLLPQLQLMFWTDHGQHTVSRSNLNGTNISIIISTGIYWPNGLAVDYAERKVYWTDGKLKKIERCDFNGANREVLLEGLGHLMDIAVSGQYVFYTAWNQGDGLHRFSKTNAKDDKRFAKLYLSRTDSIYIYSKWTLGYTDACGDSNGGCEQLCSYDEHDNVTCSCFDGYTPSTNVSTICEDIDECRVNNGGCAQTCTNFKGGHNCSCLDGYRVSSANRSDCYDVNECSENNGGCSQVCYNTPGNYSCSCLSGYGVTRGNSSHCDDIDECSRNNGRCSQVCVNYDGGYNCTCNNGFRVSTTNTSDCIDVNECLTNNGGCSQRCYNYKGGRRCLCYYGYVKTAINGTTCTDVDECQTNNGGCHQLCVNSPGSYSCECFTGYKLSTQSTLQCEDINECLDSNGGCAHTCVNKVGGFDCSCSDGYRVSPSDKNDCTDIDECQLNNGGCSQKCTNSKGSFSCSCYTGYAITTHNRSLCKAHTWTTWSYWSSCTPSSQHRNRTCNGDMCFGNSIEFRVCNHTAQTETLRTASPARPSYYAAVLVLGCLLGLAILGIAIYFVKHGLQKAGIVRSDDQPLTDVSASDLGYDTLHEKVSTVQDEGNYNHASETK